MMTFHKIIIAKFLSLKATLVFFLFVCFLFSFFLRSRLKTRLILRRLRRTFGTLQSNRSNICYLPVQVSPSPVYPALQVQV